MEQLAPLFAANILISIFNLDVNQMSETLRIFLDNEYLVCLYTYKLFDVFIATLEYPTLP